MHPEEENLDEAPDSPPHVPMHFMNGHRGWFIVIDAAGNEVIELVTSDEEEVENEGGEEQAAGNVDPIAVFWDIEMGNVGEPVGPPNVAVPPASDSSDSEEEMEVDGDGYKDIGIQCNLGAADQQGLSDSDVDSDGPVSDMEENSGSDSSDSVSDEENFIPDAPLPFANYVCGGRGRLCVRGRAASSSRYVCGGRGRHCVRGGPSVSMRGRIYFVLNAATPIDDGFVISCLIGKIKFFTYSLTGGKGYPSSDAKEGPTPKDSSPPTKRGRSVARRSRRFIGKRKKE